MLQQVASRSFPDALYCPVCHNQYEHHKNIPKNLLVCRHSLCHSCLGNTITYSQRPTCPLCQAVISVTVKDSNEFPTNAPIIELLHRMMAERDKCQVHKAERVFVCMEEGERLCEECSKNWSHQGHTIKRVEEVKTITDDTLRSWKSLWDQLDEQYKNLVASFIAEENAFKNTITQAFAQKYHLLSFKEKDARQKIEVLRMTQANIASKAKNMQKWLDTQVASLNSEVDQVYDPETLNYKSHIIDGQKELRNLATQVISVVKAPEDVTKTLTDALATNLQSPPYIDDSAIDRGFIRNSEENITSKTINSTGYGQVMILAMTSELDNERDRIVANDTGYQVQQQPLSYCQFHNAEQLLWCEVDNVQLCMSCSQTEQHKGHNMKLALEYRKLDEHEKDKFMSLWAKIDNEYNMTKTFYIDQKNSLMKKIKSRIDAEDEFLQKKRKLVQSEMDRAGVEINSVKSRFDKIDSHLDSSKSNLTSQAGRIYDQLSMNLEGKYMAGQKNLRYMLNDSMKSLTNTNDPFQKTIDEVMYNLASKVPIMEDSQQEVYRTNDEREELIRQAENVAVNARVKITDLYNDLVKEIEVLAQKKREAEEMMRKQEEEEEQRRLLAASQTGLQDTGFQDTGAQQTGFQQSGFQDTGFQNTGVQQTGFQPGGGQTGFQDTGFQNTASQQAGFQPGGGQTGFQDTGFQDTGFQNTGTQQTGFQPSGQQQTGFQQTGFQQTGFQ